MRRPVNLVPDELVLRPGLLMDEFVGELVEPLYPGSPGTLRPPAPPTRFNSLGEYLQDLTECFITDQPLSITKSFTDRE